MGKRFWLGVGILAMFLVLSIFTVYRMDNIHIQTEQALERASDLALQGDMEQAASLAHRAKARWDGNWRFTASLADQSPMDEIDRLFAEMEVYAKAKEDKHFAACCAQLSRLVGSMAEAHRPNWWNFL